MQTTDLILTGAVVLFVIITLVYYQFFMKPQKRTKERLRALHFQPTKFIEDTQTATFKYYDQKWTRLIMAWLASTSASIIGPGMAGIEYPWSAIITSVGAIFSIFALVLINMKKSDAERERNLNKAFGSMFVSYPELGDVGQLWKRMEKESEVQLDDTQIGTIVDQLAEGIKALPNYKEKTIVWETWEPEMTKRIKEMKVQRMSVLDKKYRILLVSPSNFEDTKTKGVKALIDETVAVNVQRVPMFLVYSGTTRKLFKTVDKSGKPAWADRTMGIFVDLFNIDMRDKYLAGGGYTVLSKTDALIAEYLHLFAQQSASAAEMTKTLRDREKAQREIDEKEFDSKAEAHKMMGTMKNLMDMLLSISKQGKATEDYFMWVVILVVGMLLGKIILP